MDLASGSGCTRSATDRVCAVVALDKPARSRAINLRRRVMKEGSRYQATLLAAMMASLLALVNIIPAFAQQAATATIEGVITDPNGAVVPQAKVLAKNTETGFTREIS